MFLNPPDTRCSRPFSIAFSNGGDPDWIRVSSWSLSTSLSVPIVVWALFTQKHQRCTQYPNSAHVGQCCLCICSGLRTAIGNSRSGVPRDTCYSPHPSLRKADPNCWVVRKMLCSLKLPVSASWLSALTATDLEATPIVNFILTKVIHFKHLEVLS